MKKLTKIVAILLALIMLVGLAACGNQNNTDDAGTNDTNTNDTGTNDANTNDTGTNDANTNDAGTDDGANAADDNILTMATNAAFPPYEYMDGDNIVGIDPEIAQLIADKLGMELQIVDIDFGVIVTSVQSGKYDMGMAGMTVTEERLENVNFTDSYATGVQVVIVPEDSDIKSIDDLNGKLIGVQENTTGHIYCADTPENGGFGEENVIAYTTGANAVQALMTGKVDCVVIDNEPAKAFVEANPGLKILETEFVSEDYAICVAKENTELLEKINTALKELIDDGSVKKVIDKYITD